MTKYFQNKYALSKQGAKDLCKGILYSVLAYVSLMLPVALLAVCLILLIALSWDSGQGGNILLYTVIGIVILAVIFVMHYLAVYTDLYGNLSGE